MDVITGSCSNCHGQGGSCSLKRASLLRQRLPDCRSARGASCSLDRPHVDRAACERTFACHLQHAEHPSRCPTGTVDRSAPTPPTAALDTRSDFAEAYLDPSSESRSLWAGPLHDGADIMLLEASSWPSPPLPALDARAARSRSARRPVLASAMEEMGRTGSACIRTSAGRRGADNRIASSAELHEDGTALHWITGHRRSRASHSLSPWCSAATCRCAEPAPGRGIRSALPVVAA